MTADRRPALCQECQDVFEKMEGGVGCQALIRYHFWKWGAFSDVSFEIWNSKSEF